MTICQVIMMIKGLFTVYRADSVSEISPRHSFHCKSFYGGLEIFPYEHSSPVNGMKHKRSRLVHLGNLAEIFHMHNKPS